MGCLAWLILVSVLVFALRSWFFRKAEPAPPPPRPAPDPGNPYAPPEAPDEDPEEERASSATGSSSMDETFARRMKGAMEGLGEALPLGAQGGWTFGPPPPAATLEPEPDEHSVTLSDEDLAKMRGPGER